MCTFWHDLALGESHELLADLFSLQWPLAHMMQGSGQADLPSAPVDLWIVFYQPCMPEDDGHSADTCDVEGGSFRMIPILDYEADDFSYLACFIMGSIHIIDRDGSGEMLGA